MSTAVSVQALFASVFRKFGSQCPRTRDMEGLSADQCLSFSYANFDIAPHSPLPLIYFWNGRVMWQGRVHTEWHGKVSISAGGMCIQMSFNCEGPPKKLRSASVFRIQGNIWQGRDWLGRRIRMDLMDRLILYREPLQEPQPAMRPLGICDSDADGHRDYADGDSEFELEG